MKTQTFRHLECLAYHEAGHAAVSIREGVRFQRVTIVASKDSAGSVDHGGRGRLPDLAVEETAPHLIIKWMKHARIFVAGDVAVRRFKPRSFRSRPGSRDRFCALTCAEKTVGSNKKILEAQLTVFYLQAAAIIEEDWQGVVALAQALLERRTLTFDEACCCYARALGFEQPQNSHKATAGTR